MTYIAVGILIMLALIFPLIAAEQDYLPRNPMLTDKMRRSERRATLICGYVAAIAAFVAGCLL